MIILVNPMLSQPSLNADSCYNVIRQLIIESSKHENDLFFDVLWPSNDKDWTYYKDGLFDLPNVRRLPIYVHPAKMQQVTSFNIQEWLRHLNYKIPYDIIWNHTVEVGDLLKHSVRSSAEAAKLTVVNAHHYVMHKSLPYDLSEMMPALMRQLISSAEADINVFDSQHCKNMLYENAKDYLSKNLFDAIKSKEAYIPHGVLSSEELEPLKQEKHSVFTFAYNHRLQDYKNWKKTFALFAELNQEGHEFRVKLFAHKDNIAKTKTAARHAFVDVFLSETRAEYLTELSKCHANVTNSQHETFCISAIESMYYDQLLIAPNDITFPEITGKKENNYPFLFNSKKEQKEIIKNILLNKNNAMLYSKDLKKHVVDSYSVESWAKAYIDLFKSLNENKKVYDSLKHKDAIKDLALQRKEWLFEDFRHKLYNMTILGKRLAGGHSFPAQKIKRLLNEIGFKDAGYKNGTLLLKIS